MGQCRQWTQQEYDYLQDNWGQTSIPTLCKHLNRSETAIKIKAQRLNLGSFLNGGEYISFNQCLIALGINSGGYKKISWIENRGFPIRYKTVNRNKFKVVYLSDFWEWAEKNKSLLDFYNFEYLSLGQEPSWVNEKRKIDFEKHQSISVKKWTKADDEKLLFLLRQHKYGYSEISIQLHRTCGAIQRRICDLGLKKRPVKADNTIPWTDKEKQVLGNLINKGLSYDLMPAEVGRSSKAIRGLCGRVYNTENLDTIRAMINGGNFGDGAYLYNIYEKKKSATVKNDISRLISALKYQRNKLGYDQYWQRFTCMNWDDYEGCSANETDCDRCSNYKRIPPQYCVRCGKIFFERKENRICSSCRVQRKKQAQAKWAKTGKKKEKTDEDKSY